MLYCALYVIIFYISQLKITGEELINSKGYATGVYFLDGSEVEDEDDLLFQNISIQTVFIINLSDMEIQSSENQTSEKQQVEVFVDDSTMNADETNQTVDDLAIIYREIKNFFYLNLNELTGKIKNKLQNQQNLNFAEKKEILRVFSKNILLQEPEVAKDKILVLAMQLAVRFQKLVETNENGDVLNNGCEKLQISLLNKIDYLKSNKCNNKCKSNK